MTHVDEDAQTAESAVRYVEAEELDDFVAWLEGDAEPFFEPLGRALVATAELEGAFRELLVYRLGRGEAWAAVHQLGLSQVLTALGSIAKRLDESDDRVWLADSVRRGNELLEPRNLLAHGLWLPLYRKGMAVVRHKQGQPDLRGKLMTPDDIMSLAERATALEREVRERVPPPPR
jgi:hypothetical protein